MRPLDVQPGKPTRLPFCHTLSAPMHTQLRLGEVAGCLQSRRQVLQAGLLQQVREHMTFAEVQLLKAQLHSTASKPSLP